MTVGFGLLGDLDVRVHGQPVDVGHARQRSVLVALVIDANKTVSVDQLVDRVWADARPQRAREALYSYLSRLRQRLAATSDVAISRQPGGYLLTVEPAAVDVHRFLRLVTQARAAEQDGRALALFDEALAVWRGEALAHVDGPWFDAIRHGLGQQRLAAELDRDDVALSQGQHARVLPELSTRAAAHPLDERLAGQLMLALYRCGRHGDALEHYQRTRRALAEALGAEPSPALRVLHQRILTADPALTVGETASIPSRSATRSPVPRQLPGPSATFVGRARELAQLTASLGTQADAGRAVVISAIQGIGGVGKTWLALRWAHDNLERFPDGQLYMDLRGFDPSRQALPPHEAVRALLDALGADPGTVPADLDAQAALYRSLTAGKRMLVLVDNARDVDHVRPLLPGSAGCLVLVTSRNQLPGLVAAEGAHPLTLGMLSAAEARLLLVRRLGDHRVAAEPRAVDEIIARCGRLPLALSIVAARAAARPGFPLAALATGPRGATEILDTFAGGDPSTDLRTVFASSYRTLSAEAARLFRLLSLHPGADVGTAAAASLFGASMAEVRPPLAELTRAHLLVEDLPGRYAFHELLRAYAAELAARLDTAGG